MLMNFILCIYFICIYFHAFSICCEFTINGLKHYEILDSSSIIDVSNSKNRHRKYTDLHYQSLSNSKEVAELQVPLFGVNYTLILHRDLRSIISPDFEAVKFLPNGSIVAIFPL